MVMDYPGGLATGPLCFCLTTLPGPCYILNDTSCV